MIKIFIALSILCFLRSNACLAQNAPTAQIQRSEDLLGEERFLRETIAKSEKVFIKKIVVGGVVLPQGQLEEIVAPFKNHWLSKEDIDSLIVLVKDLCVKNGYSESSLKITPQVRKATLEIKIEP